MSEYLSTFDVDVWTDYKKFALIVSAEGEGQATSLALDYLIFNNQIKREEHLTNVHARLIMRLTIPAVQHVRGVYENRSSASSTREEK